MNNTVNAPKSGNSIASTSVFAAFIIIGWLVIAYLAFFTPGGLTGAWDTVRALPVIVQIIMWLLLLPWMLALWLFHFGWPLWLRLILVFGLVWVTYFMSIPPLIQLIRGSK